MASSSVQVKQKGGLFYLDPVMTELINVGNQYLEGLKIRGCSSMTVRAYAFDILNLIRWLDDSGVDFEKIKDKDVFGWISSMKENEARPASINRRLNTCYSFFSYCYGTEIPKSAGVPYGRRSNWQRPKRLQGTAEFWRKSKGQLKVKDERRIIDPLTVDEVKEFLSHTSRYRDIGIILLMLFCGLRSNEVLLLKTDDIDFDRHRMKVLGKGSRERFLPFPEKLAVVMKRYLRYERPPRAMTDRFFVVLQGEKTGEPMTAPGLRTLFRYKRKITGVTRAHPHMWRHSFGTNMARQGVQLPILQKMMGHRNFRMTLRYINLAMADVAAEYEKAIVNIEKRYS